LWFAKKLDRTVFTREEKGEQNLKKVKMEQGIRYQTLVVPDILKACLLMLAHDKQGHNGFRRTYNSLRNMYHWKGMKRSIQLHCTRCQVCARHNIKVQKLTSEHFSSPPQPMEFIAMDLIGEFHPASSKGNRYALTAVCMLTGFTFCIPLKSKKAEDVVTAYLNNICCVFGPSRKILTDNGTEFKNKMWEEVFKRLNTEHRVTPIYSPQCNGRIEGFHKFLKATIGKQLQKGLEWDDLVSKATAAYNFFPTESSKFSPFILMFGREAAVKHMLLASQSPKYLGTDEGLLNMELMKQLFHIVAYNLSKSRKARDGNRIPRQDFRPGHIKPGKNVLVRDKVTKAFQPKYKDFTVVRLEGKNQVWVKDNHGHETKVHKKDIKPIDMDMKIAELFDEERNNKIRDAQHTMPISQIPVLNWDTVNEISASKKSRKAPQTITKTNKELLSNSKPITTALTIATCTIARAISQRIARFTSNYQTGSLQSSITNKQSRKT